MSFKINYCFINNINSVKYLIKLLSVILIVNKIIITSEAWNANDNDNSQIIMPTHNTGSSRTNNYLKYEDLNIFSLPCNCIKFKNCQPMIDLIRKFSLTPYLIAKVRKSSCGYENNEPVVCCPYDVRLRRSSKKQLNMEATEQPWVWDAHVDNNYNHRDNDDNDNSNNFYQYNHFAPIYPNIPNYFNNINDNFQKYMNRQRFLLAPFKDPKTDKNCPPTISEEFTLPKEIIKPVSETVNEEPVDQTAVDINIAPALVTLPITEPPLARIEDRASKKSLINYPLCGLSVNTRIIGGEDSGPRQFPWIARLAYKNKTSGRITYRCAGSVISDRYIVTAAHCVTNLIDDLEVVMVRLGELDSRTDTDCATDDPALCTQTQDFNIEKIIPHVNYDEPKYSNDIALVRLVRTANTSIISPLCLPIDAYSITAENITGTQGIIAGWGSMTAGSTTPSPVLQWVRLPIVDTTQCASSYARFSANSRTPIIVTTNQICVQGRENMDACQGDSGGPLMSEGVPGAERYTLLGLVSFGPRTCGVSNFPGVYTRVSAYMDWIMDNMEM